MGNSNGNQKGFQLGETIYYMIIIIILYMMITAWDELLDALFHSVLYNKKRQKQDREIGSLFAAAIFYTLMGFLILYIMNQRFVNIFGIDVNE